MSLTHMESWAKKIIIQYHKNLAKHHLNLAIHRATEAVHFLLQLYIYPHLKAVPLFPFNHSYFSSSKYPRPLTGALPSPSLAFQVKRKIIGFAGPKPRIHPSFLLKTRKHRCWISSVMETGCPEWKHILSALFAWRNKLHFKEECGAR